MTILNLEIPKSVTVRVTDEAGIELAAEASRIVFIAQQAADHLPDDPHRPGYKLAPDMDAWLVPFTDLLNVKYGTSFSPMQAFEILDGCRRALADLKKSSAPGSNSPTPTGTSASSNPSETNEDNSLNLYSRLSPTKPSDSRPSTNSANELPLPQSPPDTLTNSYTQPQETVPPLNVSGQP